MFALKELNGVTWEALLSEKQSIISQSPVPSTATEPRQLLDCTKAFTSMECFRFRSVLPGKTK